VFVESYRTEEEQVEALKNWWDENGRSTVVAIAVALGLGFGWQGWKSHQSEQVEAASIVYQGLSEALNAYENDQSDDIKATAIHLAGELKTEYSGSTYAHYAALSLAKLAVENQDLETAQAELRWVLSNSPSVDIELISQQRLARVLAAQGDSEQALMILNSTDAGKYAPGYARAKGDIYLSLGENEKALEAYQQAKTLDGGSDGASQRYLEMKIKHLSPELATVIGEEE
jgi:predicted negative regulator of RcsB-dependent stress response